MFHCIITVNPTIDIYNRGQGKGVIGGLLVPGVFDLDMFHCIIF